MNSRNERGFATAQMIVLLTLSLTFLAWFTNVLFIQYERAATSAAVADAARQAARLNGTRAECETKLNQVLQDAVPGFRKSGQPTFTSQGCDLTTDPNAVTASVKYRFDTWFPGTSGEGTIAITVQRRNQ